jgi:hypothetical protein
VTEFDSGGHLSNEGCYFVPVSDSITVHIHNHINSFTDQMQCSDEATSEGMCISQEQVKPGFLYCFL